ncbi:MAG: hypothetical protein MI725_11240 [Pirellulales bacterium]|nr:hypothetical protein [Pirellulales bacterium]
MNRSWFLGAVGVQSASNEARSLVDPMLLDRSHRLWFLVFVALTLVATGLYFWYSAVWPAGPAGRTWPGMMFGVAGTLLMIFAGLLSARKKTVRLSMGSLSWWLKGHIWLGLLSVPLIFFHAAFRWGGPVETLLMIVFLTVIVSGVLGVVLQNVVPRAMKGQLDSEVVPDQLDHLCKVLQKEADQRVIKICGGEQMAQALDGERPTGGSAENSEGWLAGLYLDTIRPYLEPGAASGSVLASSRQGELVFERARASVPEQFRETIDRLEELCRTRRNLHAQARFHGLLHGWLKIHLPLSVALLVFTLVHIVTALYY